LIVQLPRIYPITDRILSGLSHAAQVEQLIAGGAAFIQLREKHASPRDFYDDAKLAIEIARAKRVNIIINDRVDIALALDANGVHLGQDDLPPEHARKLLGEKAMIGFSTHSVSQAIAAISLPVNYIAIGPVYGTTTKENPDAAVGLEGIKAVRQSIGDFPLVAIGGIKNANLSDVLAAGADSAAIISDLFRDQDNISQTFSMLTETASRSI
jgi:thiamine-phosphate pyrophosphorylase